MFFKPWRIILYNSSDCWPSLGSTNVDGYFSIVVFFTSRLSSSVSLVAKWSFSKTLQMPVGGIYTTGTGNMFHLDFWSWYTHSRWKTASAVELHNLPSRNGLYVITCHNQSSVVHFALWIIHSLMFPSCPSALLFMLPFDLENQLFSHRWWFHAFYSWLRT